MRVAISYRPRSAAPMELAPMLFGALDQWFETYAGRFTTFEFLVDGGGLAVADFDDTAELQGILAENPFTPHSDVQIRPVVEPRAALDGPQAERRGRRVRATPGHPVPCSRSARGTSPQEVAVDPAAQDARHGPMTLNAPHVHVRRVEDEILDSPRARLDVTARDGR